MGALVRLLWLPVDRQFVTVQRQKLSPWGDSLQTKFIRAGYRGDANSSLESVLLRTNDRCWLDSTTLEVNTFVFFMDTISWPVAAAFRQCLVSCSIVSAGCQHRCSSGQSTRCLSRSTAKGLENRPEQSPGGSVSAAIFHFS